MAALAAAAVPCRAQLAIEVPANCGAPCARFREHLESALRDLRDASAEPVSHLHRAAARAPARITIRPITDDPATWHEDGDRTRAHTDPADGGKKSLGRSEPTPALLYLPPANVDPDSPQFKSGVLAHELVHAVDLAHGRYHKAYEVRERRAVFMQNLWRDQRGYKLRRDYHGRFPTGEYAYAKRTGKLAEFADYIHTRDDFPPPPAMDKPTKTGAGDD